MIDTIRVDFPGSNYWVIKKELTLAMARAAEREKAKFLVPRPENNSQISVDLSDGKLNLQTSAKLPERFEVDILWDKMDWDSVYRAMLLAGTVAWSYGDISAQVYENEVPLKDINEMRRRADELYVLDPLAVKTVAGSPGRSSRLAKLRARLFRRKC